jgi:hypothetical protein
MKNLLKDAEMNKELYIFWKNMCSILKEFEWSLILIEIHSLEAHLVSNYM